MPMKPFAKAAPSMPDNDPDEIPYNHTRLGECGDCGGDVTIKGGGSGGVPRPASCRSCGAVPKSPLPMKAAPKKAPPKGNYAKAKGAAKAGYASLKAKKSMV